MKAICATDLSAASEATIESETVSSVLAESASTRSTS